MLADWDLPSLRIVCAVLERLQSNTDGQMPHWLHSIHGACQLRLKNDHAMHNTPCAPLFHRPRPRLTGIIGMTAAHHHARARFKRLHRKRDVMEPTGYFGSWKLTPILTRSWLCLRPCLPSKPSERGGRRREKKDNLVNYKNSVQKESPGVSRPRTRLPVKLISNEHDTGQRVDSAARQRGAGRGHLLITPEGCALPRAYNATGILKSQWGTDQLQWHRLSWNSTWAGRRREGVRLI